jgi:sulfatase maturation enzyme AslB (radical SAM superfamily)
MESKFICPIPWMSLCFGPKSTLRACCHQNGSMEKNLNENLSNQEIIQLKHNQDLRTQMQNGLVPKECMTCFDIEKSGSFSPRQEYLAKFEFNQETPPKVEYLDLTVDNNCNLECAMCSSYYSYKIDDFYTGKLNLPRVGKWEINFSDENIKELLPDLKMLTITGGEPFLSKRALDIINFTAASANAKNINLRLFTNLTIIPKNLEDLLNQFKSVELLLSIDSVEENYEFIRYPGKWSLIMENLKKLSTLKFHNTTIKVHSVVSAFNWNHIDKLIAFYSSLNLKNQNIFPVFIEIENQPYLHPSVLPKKDFEQGLAQINSAVDNVTFSDPQNQYEINHFKNMLIKIAEVDSRAFYIDYITYIEKLKQGRKNISN